MKPCGSFPVGTIGDDLVVEQELLEAPIDEPTLLGGFHGGIPIRRPSLAEQLDAWHEETWRAEA